MPTAKQLSEVSFLKISGNHQEFASKLRQLHIKETLPDESQFKASELRALPKVNPGFLDSALANKPLQQSMALR